MIISCYTTVDRMRKGKSNMERQAEMMTVKEIQGKLGLSRQGTYNLVNRPDFPTVRVGRKILIPVSGFSDWLQKGGTRNEADNQ